eukprot:464725-Hanusia_phi.AAC.2
MTTSVCSHLVIPAAVLSSHVAFPSPALFSRTPRVFVLPSSCLTCRGRAGHEVPDPQGAGGVHGETCVLTSKCLKLFRFLAGWARSPSSSSTSSPDTVIHLVIVLVPVPVPVLVLVLVLVPVPVPVLVPVL